MKRMSFFTSIHAFFFFWIFLLVYYHIEQDERFLNMLSASLLHLFKVRIYKEVIVPIS